MADEVQAVGIGPVLGASGACPTITHKDKTWTVGWPTQKAKTELEMIVVLVARENLECVKDVYSPEEFAQEKEVLRSLIRGGEFKTWKRLWMEVCAGTSELIYTVCSLIRTKHPEFTLTQMRELWTDATEDVMDAYIMVTPNFIPLLVSDIPNTGDGNREQTAAKLFAALQKVIELRHSLAPTPNAS